jgi:hypothetical protein
MNRTRARFFYGPGDWLAGRFTARQRRAIAAWLMIWVIISTPFQFPWRNSVTLVWTISQIALILGLWAVVSGETPVEEES